ncbi:hypothetical protein [Serratia marcescens]|uniref:hypothetical protein n=1 Tax=Serratia marcescens TaxID=615 RepID=UPI0027E3F3A8|nr:hypothetical protein [Serratia marcescens]
MDGKVININLLPLELNNIIMHLAKPLPQKCYENCGVITLLASGDNNFAMYCKEKGWQVSYCLGLLTDCYGKTHPHAWIKINQDCYCDPTLQNNSQTWLNRIMDFNYVVFHELTPSDIVDFFKVHYSEREFNDYGIPCGQSQYPIIDLRGKLTCEKDIENNNNLAL